VETARDAMLELRAALLRASGLDERTEPVPLLVADPVAATISLALYMDGLLQRAARMTARSRVDIAAHALALVTH
jgi:hypothetical protein